MGFETTIFIPLFKGGLQTFVNEESKPESLNLTITMLTH